MDVQSYASHSQSVTAAGAIGGTASARVQSYSHLSAATSYEAIQRAGEQRGDSQAVIEQSKATYAEAAGLPAGRVPTVREAVSEYARAHGLSPSQEADAERELNHTLDQMVARMAEGEEVRNARAGAKGGGGGQSWLMRLAEALGRKLDKMAAEMDTMANQITDKTPSLTAKFGAKSQEFGIMMNAATNAIKTIGEAQANSARKG